MKKFPLNNPHQNKMPNTAVLGLFFDPKTTVFGNKVSLEIVKNLSFQRKVLNVVPIYCLSRTPHEFWKITVPLSSVS